MDSREKVTIKIPRPLYNRLQLIIDGTGFSSVTDFVVWVLRDLVSLPARRSDRMDESLTRDDVESIRERLRNLGYL